MDTIDTPEFWKLLNERDEGAMDEAHATDLEQAIIAHIEAVREKDREAEREKLKAQITHMTHRMNTALAANRQLEAERDQWKANHGEVLGMLHCERAARQAPDLSKLERWNCTTGG